MWINANNDVSQTADTLAALPSKRLICVYHQNTIHKDKLSNLNGNMRSTTYMMTMRNMTKLMTNMYDAYIYNDEHKKYDFLLSPSRPNAMGLDLAKLNRC